MGLNWTSGSSPLSPTGTNPGENLLFGGNNTLNTNDITGTLVINSITFASGASAFTLGGNAVAIGDLSSASPATGVVNNATVTETVGNSTLVILSNQTWNAASGNLVITSAVKGSTSAYNSSSSATITLEGTGGSVTVSGSIADGGGVALALNVTGGTTILTGPNSYSGGTTITGGTLESSNATGLGSSSGSLSINGGGTLNIEDTNQTVGAVTLGTGGSTIQSTGGTATLTTAGVTVNGTGNTLASSVDVAGNITLNSNSALADNGAITGGVTVSSGATFSGSGSVSGTTGVTSGTISGSGLTLTGVTTFNSTGNTLSGTVTSTNGVTLAAAAALADNGALTGNITVGSGTLTGTGSVSGTTGVTGGTINGSGLTLTGVTTFNSTGNTLSGTVTSTNGVTLAGSAALANNATVTGGISIGAGTLTGTGGSFSGASTLNGGTINLTSGSFGSTLGVTGGNWNGKGSVAGLVTSSSGNFNIGSGADLTATSGLDVTGGTLSSTDATGTITGSVNYTSSSNSTFAGVIGGGGNSVTMNNASAALILTGANSYGGGTTITAGAVEAGSASALGSGPVINNGTLEAYGSQHSINVAGSYTQNSGGTLVINLNTAPVGATMLAPTNDLLNVTTTATLNGTLAVNFNYAPAGGTTFEIVQTGGGIQGTPGANFTTPVVSPAGLKITTSESMNNDDFLLTVDATNLSLASTSSGFTANQTAILNAVDNLPSTNPLVISLINQIQGASAQTASQFSSDLANDLDPVKLTNFFNSTTFNNASFSNQELTGYLNSQHSSQGDFLTGNGALDTSRLSVLDPNTDPGLAQIRGQLLAWDPAPLGQGLLSDTTDSVTAGIDTKAITPAAASPDTGALWSAFVIGNAILAQGFSQADQNIPHSDATTEGGQAGVGFRITPHLRIGPTFAYSHTDTDLDENGSKATADSYIPGGFISFVSGGWYANVVGNYGFDRFTEDTHFSTPGLGVAHGAPSGDQIGADFDAGYDFHIQKLTIGPSIGLQYTHLDVDSFAEDGALANRTFWSQESDSMRSELGGHVSYVFQAGDVLLVPHLDASWQHEFMNAAQGINTQVNGSPFLVTTPNPSRDSALIDLGLNADLNGAWTLFGDYLVQAGQSDYFGQSVQAGARLGF